MAISTSCPHCGTSYRLSEEMSNKKVRCKKCQGVFTPSAEEPPGVLTVEPAEISEKLLPPLPRSASRARRAMNDDIPVLQEVQKPKSQARRSALPWVLAIGGLSVAAVFVVGIGGVAIWLHTRPQTNSKREETSAVAEKSNAAKSLEELKAATAYVKVTAGNIRATGSGFVIKVDGNTGYIVTNDHVVHPDRDVKRAGPARESEITLVFWSGSKQEQTYRAELAATDPERDLAVLKVTGAANLPQPIDISNDPKLVETLPVTVYGFPFGDALAMHEGNPTITVSKGSVSSIRRDNRDQVVAVQIDGALNPGNSGGPVVDAEGRLVGVAVATIRGANIGLAIPGGELNTMLAGHVGEVYVASRNIGNANASVGVVVPVIDPLKHVDAVEVAYIRSDLVKVKTQPDARGIWPELRDAQRLTLRREGQLAIGSFIVLAADQDKTFTFQASYVDATGQRVYTQPRAMWLQVQDGPVVRRPPDQGNPPRIDKPPDNRPPIGPPPDVKPPPRPTPIKRQPATPYTPHLPEGEQEKITLAGPVADVVTGGGGRYLILRLADKKNLAVFDVEAGKVVKELPLAEETVHVAAGATRLVVVYPNAKRIQFWDLATLEKGRSAPLPDHLTNDTIHQICMGSASPSAGPLFVYLPKEKRTLALNLDNLETSEVGWTNWAPNNAYGPQNMRASPDGSTLIGWGGGWAGLDVATFREGQQVGTFAKLEFWATEGVFALPSADGRFIYTSWAIVDRDFKASKVEALKNGYVVPAVEPGFFLAVPGACNPGSGVVKAQPAGDVSVYSEDRKLLIRLNGLNELKLASDLPWERRLHYYPRAGLLVTVGGDKDKMTLRRVNLLDTLAETGDDYLMVFSRPPLAKPGAAFSYRLDVRSKKGGVKVKLESGPKDLKVTPEGQVTWDVPAKPDQAETEVLLTITDGSGREVFHSFRIEVEER